MIYQRQIKIAGEIGTERRAYGPRLFSHDREVLRLCGFEVESVQRRPKTGTALITYRSKNQTAEIFYAEAN